MKRILLLLSTLALMTSCVVDTDSNRNRTPSNLAYFVAHQYRETVGACLSLLASDSFGNTAIIGNQISVTITRITDESVHVEGEGADAVFSFDALRLPGQYGRSAFILSDLSYRYDEKNNYVMEMHFDGDMRYDWLESASSTYVSYSLEPSGVLNSEFYKEGEQVDYCKLVYDCGEMQFYTSVSW